jgi:3-methyladenine DNA glycosylase AlkD
MHSFIQPIKSLFEQHADNAHAVGAKAYMLNQFEFYGLKTALRRQICMDYMKTHPLNGIKEVEKIVKELWNLPEREFQYTGVELLAFYKKQWTPLTVKLMEYCIVYKSWWDSVDHMASNCTGPFFLLFPELTKEITGKWNRGKNIWLQRSSIMFQKAYRAKTDTGLLSTYILHCKGSNEFFVLKAIGWALREYSKTDPGWVSDFCNTYKLYPLSHREALKRINRQ